MEDDENTLFIKGLPCHIEKDDIVKHFSKYGEVVSCFVANFIFFDPPRNSGFVKFALMTAAQEALRDTHHIDGKLVEVKKLEYQFKPKQQNQENTSTISTSSGGSHEDFTNKKIFVGGLSPDLTCKEFRDYFEKFGKITDIVVMHDTVTNRPRGFGFVTFEYADSIKEVTNKQFHELKGKQVEVKMSIPKERMGGGSNFNHCGNRFYFCNPLPSYGPLPYYGCNSMYPFGAGIYGGSEVYGRYMMAPLFAPRHPWYYPTMMVGNQGSPMPYVYDESTMPPVYGDGTIGSSGGSSPNSKM